MSQTFPPALLSQNKWKNANTVATIPSWTCSDVGPMIPTTSCLQHLSFLSLGGSRRPNLCLIRGRGKPALTPPRVRANWEIASRAALILITTARHSRVEKAPWEIRPCWGSATGLAFMFGWQWLRGGFHAQPSTLELELSEEQKGIIKHVDGFEVYNDLLIWGLIFGFHLQKQDPCIRYDAHQNKAAIQVNSPVCFCLSCVICAEFVKYCLQDY